jgi:RNA polymerase sigma-70 factor (ECF subfamily)
VSRIAIHEALARVRRRNRIQQLDSAYEDGESLMNPATRLLDPEQNTSQSELSRMLEEEILALPE